MLGHNNFLSLNMNVLDISLNFLTYNSQSSNVNECECEFECEFSVDPRKHINLILKSSSCTLHKYILFIKMCAMKLVLMLH